MQRNSGILALLLLSCTAASPQETAAPVLASKEEILAELKGAPKKNDEREAKLVELYIQAGAKKDEVRQQEVKGYGHNIIVTRKGTGEKSIVIGGHLDKVRPGDGVIDDWSGATMAANLYQAFRSVPTTHTLIFIGFCGEESGLKGSRAYVESLSDEERDRCVAMVNLEVLGVGGPFIWTNGSTDRLEKVLHAVAEREKLIIEDHVIEGVGADSLSFEAVSIPNITIDGLPLDRMGIIHSPQDTFEKIDGDVYYETYKLTAAFLRELDTNGVPGE